jgi:hypothetical protein
MMRYLWCVMLYDKVACGVSLGCWLAARCCRCQRNLHAQAMSVLHVHIPFAASHCYCCLTLLPAML